MPALTQTIWQDATARVGAGDTTVDVIGTWTLDLFHTVAVDFQLDALGGATSVQVKIQRLDDSGHPYVLIASAALNAAGDTSYEVGTAVNNVTNVKYSGSPGKRLQVTVTQTGAGSPKYFCYVHGKG